MSWKKLENKRLLQKHRTSRKELADLQALVKRDLKDAALSGLSPDRRFATAYNAVLQSVKIVIACAGYRVKGQAHHQTTFEALLIAMGPVVADLADYFDTCRRKRNIVDYDKASVVSSGEAMELLDKARAFQRLTNKWVAKNYPNLFNSKS